MPRSSRPGSPSTMASLPTARVAGMVSSPPSLRPITTRAVPGRRDPSGRASGMTASAVMVASGATSPRSMVRSTRMAGSQVTTTWMAAANWPGCGGPGHQAARGHHQQVGPRRHGGAGVVEVVEPAGGDERRPRLGGDGERRHQGRAQQHLVGQRVDDAQVVAAGVGDGHQLAERPGGVGRVAAEEGHAGRPLHLGRRAGRALGAAGQRHGGQQPGGQALHGWRLPIRRGFPASGLPAGWRSRSAEAGSARGTRRTLTVQSVKAAT